MPSLQMTINLSQHHDEVILDYDSLYILHHSTVQVNKTFTTEQSLHPIPKLNSITVL